MIVSSDVAEPVNGANVISSLRIHNYRCFKRLHVKLAPLTVVIGKNDTGKSSFLRAILAWDWQQKDLTADDFFRRSSGASVEIAADFRDVSLTWSTEQAHRDQHFKVREKYLASNGLPRRLVQLFQFGPSGVPMASPVLADADVTPEFMSDGGNLPTLLDRFLRRDRRRFTQFVESARVQIAGLEDVNIRVPSPGQLAIDLSIDHGFDLDAGRASTGVRLMLFFVALSCHPALSPVLLIEEPENGVHPQRLGEIMKVLRGITRGAADSKPAQVILTTHSPYLLDHINLDTDQVLVFRRNDDGSRTAEPADKDRLKEFLDEFMLGEIWYNQSEEGLIKRGS
ncbi:hypothetical protein RAS1_00510 [Phycisphaerae bacterium RAS1]|nr:hypothetical protein RAS1_00510 [Phycisphaerae bacterium RAS1]